MITTVLAFIAAYVVMALAIWRLVDIAYEEDIWEEEE